MVDITKKQSLLKLWIPTFQAVNNTIGMLIKVLALFFLPLLFLGAAAAMMPHFPLAGIVAVLFAVILGFLFCILPTVLTRQYAAHLEQRVEAISQSITASVLPTIFIVVVGLLCGVVFALLIGLLFVMHFSKLAFLVWGVLMIALVLLVGVRLIYTVTAIAIREKDPIEAMEYSWRMTEGKGYWRALGMWGFLLLGSIVPSVIRLAMQYFIPLYMPVDFSSWPIILLIAIAIVLLFIGIAINLLVFVYPIVVFINTENTKLSKEWAKPAEMHVVNKHKASTVKTQDGNGEVKFEGEETIRLSAEEIQSITVQSTPVAAEGGEKNLQAHLDQVFQKAPEGVAQSGDEDRMPTILFDDEMAQQLEENRKMFNKKEDKKSENNDEGPGSVKMSK